MVSTNSPSETILTTSPFSTPPQPHHFGCEWLVSPLSSLSPTRACCRSRLLLSHKISPRAMDFTRAGYDNYPQVLHQAYCTGSTSMLFSRACPRSSRAMRGEYWARCPAPCHGRNMLPCFFSCSIRAALGKRLPMPSIAQRAFLFILPGSESLPVMVVELRKSRSSSGLILYAIPAYSCVTDPLEIYSRTLMCKQPLAQRALITLS